MNVTIRPGAATADAENIDTIVNSIKQNMEKLDQVFRREIPAGIETSWSESLLQRWSSTYKSEIPATMDAMSLSAVNLRKAVQELLKFSNQE